MAAKPAERRRILRPFLKEIQVYPKENKAVVELFRMPITEAMREHTGSMVPPRGVEPSGAVSPIIDSFVIELNSTAA